MDEKEKIQTEKDLSRGFGMLEKITFMSNLLEKQNEIRNMLDVRSNIVIGFNSALIFVFATAFYQKIGMSPIYYFVLAILIASLFFAILALKPPHWSTKKGQKESIFYHHYIASKPLEDYNQEIRNVLHDESKIFDAYITETYNLTRYSNIPRKFYLHLSIRVLIYGLGIIAVSYGIYSLLTFLSQ